MLGDGWHTVGFWLAHCWFMVGRMLHYGWRFMLGQRVSNEQSNVGPTKYVAVGPTLNQRLGFGWRMVIVLAGASVELETIWLVGPIGLRFQPVIFHNYRIEMYVWCIAVCVN